MTQSGELPPALGGAGGALSSRNSIASNNNTSTTQAAPPASLPGLPPAAASADGGDGSEQLDQQQQEWEGEEQQQHINSAAAGTNTALAAACSPYLRCRGLPFSAGEAELREFFVGFELEDVYVCKREGRSTGEAFVRLSDPTQTKAVLEQLHRKEMGHRYIEIFQATGADVQTAKYFNMDQIQGYVVRMRGLPYSASASDVLDFFEGIEVKGGIEGVIFSWNPDGRPTGEAFVELVDEQGQREAMKRHKDVMGSGDRKRYIELFISTKSDLYRAAHHNHLILGFAHRKQWLQQAGLPPPHVMYPPHLNVPPMMSHPMHPANQPRPNLRPFMGGGNGGVDDMSELFAGINMNRAAGMHGLPNGGGGFPPQQQHQQQRNNNRGGGGLMPPGAPVGGRGVGHMGVGMAGGAGSNAVNMGRGGFRPPMVGPGGAQQAGFGPGGQGVMQQRPMASHPHMHAGMRLHPGMMQMPQEPPRGGNPNRHRLPYPPPPPQMPSIQAQQVQAQQHLQQRMQQQQQQQQQHNQAQRSGMQGMPGAGNTAMLMQQQQQQQQQHAFLQSQAQQAALEPSAASGSGGSAYPSMGGLGIRPQEPLVPQQQQQQQQQQRAGSSPYLNVTPTPGYTLAIHLPGSVNNTTPDAMPFQQQLPAGGGLDVSQHGSSNSNNMPMPVGMTSLSTGDMVKLARK